MAGDLQRFDDFRFNGDLLSLRVRGGRQYVSGTRVCEVFRLNSSAQYATLAANDVFDDDLWAESTAYGRVWYIAIDVLPIWLTLFVNSADLPPQLRPKHEVYKKDFKRAAKQYLLTGLAVNSKEFGEQGAADIVAFATQVKAAHNQTILSGAEYVRKYCPTDALGIALADQAVKGMLAEATGGTADSSDLPCGVRPVTELAGIKIPPKHISAFGTRIRNRYKAMYGGKEPETSSAVFLKTGLALPAEVSPTGHVVRDYNVYSRKDWHWIQDEARKFMREMSNAPLNSRNGS